MELLKQIKRGLAEAVGSKSPQMQICMMGARGVGKTSVLTSMFHDLNSVNEFTGLMLTTRKDEKTGLDMTSKMITAKYKELMDMFEGAAKGELVRASGIAGDMEERAYYFQFGLKGRSIRINLTVKDFPGEFLETQPDVIRQFLTESNAVVIAIDTPYMMEEGGRFHQAKNLVAQVTEFIKTEFANLAEDKLVLFVPLKCEKYRTEGRMDEVRETVERSYGELLSFFRESKIKPHIAAAITPIFTVGEVLFQDFLRDDSGEIKVLGNGLPARPQYRFSRPGAIYAPKYCEQPLCYLLAFVVKLYQRTQNSAEGGLLAKLASIFKLFPDDPSLLLEISKFSKRKVKDRDGYKILVGEHLV